MEDTKRRLREKMASNVALYRGLKEEKQGEGMLNATVNTNYGVIDDSPITSPENMRATRTRLSRLVEERHKAGKEKTGLDALPSRLFTSTRASPTAGKKSHSAKEDHGTPFSPTRSRKRVTIEPRPFRSEDEPPVRPNPRLNGRALLRARSLSPLPNRYPHMYQPQYPQHDVHNMNLAEPSDTTLAADLNGIMLEFQALNIKLTAQLDRVSNAYDSRSLHNELDSACHILRDVGIIKVQLWTKDLDQTDSEGYSTHHNGSEFQLNPHLSKHLTYTHDHMQSLSTTSAAMVATPAGVSTWLPGHSSFGSLLNIAQHYDDLNKVVAVHGLSVFNRCSDPPHSPHFGKALGLLLAIESTVESSTLLTSEEDGMLQHQNILKLRRFLIQQMFQRIASAVEGRLSLLQSRREHERLVQLIEETELLLQNREDEIDQRDAVIAVKEAQLRAKDMKTQCHDALLTCATLLNESKLYHSTFIASAVAKSGSVGDKLSHHTSYCWMLFKESESFDPRHLAESSVCAISGQIKEGYSPVSTVSGHNKLITRLLHGDASGQSVARVTASKRELFEAGLPISDAAGFDVDSSSVPPGSPPRSPSRSGGAGGGGSGSTWRVLSFPLQIKLPDKLAYDCPGHCSTQAAVVIAVPPQEDVDLFASHATSLAHLAQTAFESLRTQYESTQRQNLLSIPAALYDAVVTVRPAPVSEEYSPMKGSGRRNAVGAAVPQPVPFEPHYQSALNFLCNAVNSAELAHKFGARRSVLLVSDIVACSLKLIDAPAEARKLSFLTTAGHSLQAISCPTIDLSVTSWLQELYQGNVVYYDSAISHAATALPDTFNVDQSLRGAVGAKQRTQVSPAGWEAHQLLRALVQAVDAHTSYCVLVPIRTAAGLSVLMLIDKLSNVAGVTHTSGQHSRAEVIPFASEYISAVINAGVCSELKNCLDILHQQCSAFWAERKLASEIEAQEETERKLCELVESAQAKSLLTTQFAKWKLATNQKTDQETLNKREEMLNAVLQLVSHRRLDESVDCKESFLNVFEAQLKALFPFDIVKLTENAPVGGTGTLMTDDEFAPQSLQRDIIDQSDRRTLSTSSSSRSSLQRTVVVTVKLTRPLKLNRRFTPSELQDFDTFCTHASEVYSALSRGFSNDNADGDIRSLVFPLLQQLLPALLGTADRSLSTGASLAERSIQALLPLLVQWMKRACNADMVLLRLNPWAGVQNETLLSSEEVENSHIESLKDALPLLNEFVHQHTNQTSTTGIDTVTETAADHIVLKFMDRSQDGGAPLGEMKILSTSSKKQFSNEQRTVAQIVSYLLAFTVRSTAHAAHTKAADQQLRQEALQLQNALQASQQALTNENRSSEAFKSRLANILSAIMFTDKVAAAASLQELAALVSDGLPKLVGVSSAVLLVQEAPKTPPPPGPFGLTPLPEATFRVILPQSRSSESAHANTVMTLSQLRQVPMMFEAEAAQQCRIDLISPDEENVFGSILLFRAPLSNLSNTGRGRLNERDNDTVTYELWHGLEDILRNALSAAMFQCTARIASQERIAALQKSLHKATVRLQDQEHLEPDVANLLAIKADLEDQRDALQTDVATLQGKMEDILNEKKTKLLALEGEIEAIKARSEDASKEFSEKIDTLDRAFSEERASLQQLDASKKQLLELVSSFSFDQRCEQETILFWLKDVAENADSSLHLIAQDEGGALRGAEGIRGIMSAVGEAVRTGLTVEFTSALQSNDSQSVSNEEKISSAPRKTFVAAAPTALRFSRSDGSSTDYTQTFKFDASTQPPRVTKRSTLQRGSPPVNEHAHIAVLCVPNRCVAATSTNEQACFVFVKTVASADEKFTAEEKDLLNSAANLSSRTLVQCANKLSERDFRLLEAELTEIQQREARLRQVIALGEVLRQRHYATKMDVSSGVEIGVKDLLSRGHGDSCVVESALWLPPWNTVADGNVSLDRSVHSLSGGAAHSADVDALQRVLSTGQRLRRRSVCWVPLFDQHHEVIAILRVERRFAESADTQRDVSSSPSSASEDSSTLPTIAHLVISDLEEDMLVQFGNFVVPLLERMDFLDAAHAGVQQAGQAIVALQGVKVAVEDKYTQEVAHRLELEESLKAGAEMLGMTNSTRVATEQLLDATRKSILSFTSSLDCFIIMPTVPVTSAPVSSDTDRPESALAVEYCTFTADLPREVAVTFEQGDLEVVAMQNFRAIAAAGENIPRSDTQGLINLHSSRVWQSWAVRRIHTHTSFGMDFESKHGDSEEPELYSLAVPFALRSGAVAVVSVVRRAAPFSSTDRECITWVSKVLAYCLERKGGEEAMLETIQQVKSLQGEIARLQEIDSKLTELEEDAECLSQDISSGKLGPVLPKELQRYHQTQSDESQDAKQLSPDNLDLNGLDAIISTAWAVFGAKADLDTYSNAEALSYLGNIVSPAETGQVPLPPSFKAAAREVLEHQAGSVTCWVDAEGSVHEGLQYFRSLASLATSKESNKSAQTTRMRLRHNAAQHNLTTASEDAVVYLLVQLKGYPITWLRVGNLGSKVGANLSLRLSMLLQLLCSVEPWRRTAIATHNQLIETRQAQIEEQTRFAEELERRAQLVEDIKTSFATNLGGTKDKYKTIVTEKSVNYRKAEKIFTETLIAAQAVRDQQQNQPTRTKKELARNVLENLMLFAKTAQNVSGVQVALAQCATSSVRDSAAQIPEIPALASRSTSSEGAVATKVVKKRAGMKNDAPVNPWSAQFASEHEAPLQWLTQQPSGLDSRRSLSGSAPMAQHAAIRVELYGGLAHTNPLQIALATGKNILFIPEGSAADSSMKESLTNICRKLDRRSGSGVDSSSICLNPSEQYPLYSIIVPVVLTGVDTTVLVVLRPSANSAESAEEVSKYVLYSLLAGVITVKQACLEVLHRHMHNADSAVKCKKLALSGMKRALAASEHTRTTQAFVFEKMRSARLTAKLNAALAMQSQLSSIRAQTRLLEQANADWTEIVKGLNGASAGIPNGIAGLWAQACPTLMGLMSSQVTLKGCGLLVPSESRESHVSDGIMEYTVRELSTPLSFPNRVSQQQQQGGGINKFSPPTDGEISDYARGALESRPASDLGGNVLNLVQDIFSGRTGNQRIFKLSRAKTNSTDGDSTSLWLVPIRTARAVLGVLRVSVETPHNVDVPAGKLDEVLREQSEVLEAAQSNIINFSEVLAPLYLAAQLLDKSKRANSRLEDANAQSTAQVKLMTQEFSQTSKKSSLLSAAMQAVGVLGAAELALPLSKPEDCLRIFCNRLALSLSDKLSGRVVVHIHRNIISLGAFDSDHALTAADAPVMEAGSVSETLSDHAGKPFGRIIFTPNADSAEAVSETTARKLYATSSKSLPAAAFVLQALSPVVAGLLLRTAKEIGAGARLSTALEQMRELEDALHSEQMAVALCEQKNEEQGQNNEFYRGLAEVINQCLVYCSTDQKERLKYPIDGETYYFSLSKGLQATLSNLCVKLPTLVGQNCTFSFALLDSKSGKSNANSESVLPTERRKNNVTWVHAGADEKTGPFDWHSMGHTARDMVMNLAHTCIAKRFKSACDIGVNLERESHDNATMNASVLTVQKLTTLRVISYPLVDQNTSVVLGVVQCILNPDAQRPEIDNLCEDVANCVSSLLSVEVQQQKLCGRTQVQKLQMLTAEVTHTETSQLKDIWQQRCRAWHALCLLATSVTKSTIGAEKFLDVIGSSAVSSLLCDSGIRLSLRPGSIADAHRQLTSSGTRNILASALLPVTGSGDLVAEIVCDQAAVDAISSHGVLPEHQGITMIATDLVETTADIFRGAIAIHQAQQEKVHETNKHTLEKITKLKHELRRTKDQLHTASDQNTHSLLELEQQAAKFEKLRENTTTAVNKLCAPVIAELSKQLETICNLLLAGGEKEDSELLQELQMLSSRASSPRSPRKASGSMPDSPTRLRLDSPEESDEFAAVLQPVSDLVTGLRSVVTRVARLRVQERVDAQKLELEKLHDTHLQKQLQTTEQLHAQQQAQIQKQLADHQAAALKLQQQSHDLVLQHQQNVTAQSTGPSVKSTAVQVPMTFQQTQAQEKSDREESLKLATAQMEHALLQLSRARKVHRVVCREASALLDPPFVSNNTRNRYNDDESTARVVHPASLTPLAASQDCCVKLLGMVRTLLRSEGQSLLLRDPGTDPVTYQVIYSGNALHWAGIEQGTFGVVSSSSTFVSADGTLRTSLAETAIHTRKTLLTPNAPMDPRYYAYIDGICDLGTPMLMVPVRGRGGSVVGVLIAARGKDSAPFSAEDIVAAEICSTLGALSLYWCQGMGTLHHQLVQSTNKVAKLERMLERAQENADSAN